MLGTTLPISPVTNPSQELTLEQLQFFQQLWVGVGHGVFVLEVLEGGAEFRFVQFNPAIAQGLPQFPDRWLNQPLAQALGPLADSHRIQYQTCVQLGEPLTFTAPWELHDRAPWFLFSVSPWRQPSGHVDHLIVTAIELSDRQATATATLNPISLHPSDRKPHDRASIEHPLQQFQDKLTFLIQATPLGVIEWNANFEIVGWNPAAEKIFGYTAQEVQNAHARLLVPAALHPLLDRLIDDLLTRIGSNHNINENLTKDGQTIICEWFNTTLRDSAGNPTGIYSMVWDVTDRVSMETALRESEQRFRDVAEAAGEYIWECDAEGRYTFVTDQAQEVKGFTVDQLLGRYPSEFMLPEDVPQLQDVISKAAAQRSTFQLECRNVTPTGEIVWEEVRGVPILDGPDDLGDIIGWRGTSLSITQRKEAEAALRRSEAQLRQKAEDLEQTLEELQQAQLQLIQSEKMSSLGQLVAGVAHEINNPTSFIYGNIKHATGYVQDLLALVTLYQTHYPTPPADLQERIEDIDLPFIAQDLPKVLSSMKMGAERIKQIVLSLRNFSRMDEAAYKTVDIHDGIDSTLVILEHRLKANHTRPAIRVEKDYGDLPGVDCFVGQLNQVFMNILSNAIDALEQALADNPDRPAPMLSIRTKVLDADRIAIHIRDNGPGMPESVRQRLFDPFFTTKPVGQGTGMGLSISYQIVTDKHHGTLECHSQPEAGAEFIVTLPIKQHADTIAEPPAIAEK